MRLPSSSFIPRASDRMRSRTVPEGPHMLSRGGWPRGWIRRASGPRSRFWLAGSLILALYSVSVSSGAIHAASDHMSSAEDSYEGTDGAQSESENGVCLNSKAEDQSGCLSSEPEVYQRWSYLPSPDCMKLQMPIASTDSCWPAFNGNWNCIQVLKQRVSNLQLNSCARPRALKHRRKGFGVTMTYLTVAVMQSFQEGRSVIFGGGNFDWGGCQFRNTSCSFRKLSGCNPVCFDVAFGDHPVTDDSLEGCDGVEEYDHVLDRFWNLDPEYSKCFVGSNSLFHYYTSIQSVILRPLPGFVETARRTKQIIGLPDRYLGVHIRHGDSCIVFLTSKRVCHGIHEYADALASMSEQYGINSIYVATDNPGALDLLRRKQPRLQYYWNSEADRDFLSNGLPEEGLPLGRQEYGASENVPGYIENKLRSADFETQKKQTQDLFTDLEIMAGCVGFVGGFKSNLSRVYFEHASHRHGRVIPYISVDGSAWRIWDLDIPGGQSKDDLEEEDWEYVQNHM